MPRRILAAIDQMRARLMNPATLTRRAVEATLWQIGDQTLSQAMRLGGNLVLTRLLAPEQFGVMAMAMVIQTGLIMATDIGVNLSVIRSKHGEDPEFLRSAWTIKLEKHALVSALLVGVGLLMSYLAGAMDFGDTVYADPVLGLVVAAMALQVLLRGADSVALALGERRLAFRTIVIAGVSAQAVGLAVMIVAALIEPSVWALVYGGVATAATRCLLSHVVVPGPRMALRRNAEHRREIWGYGKWLMGASVFSFFSRQGDRLLLGALLAPLEFSIYAIARLWIDASNTALMKVSEPVVRSSLTEVTRERPKAVARALTRTRAVQTVVSVGAFGFFVFFGETMIGILYTPAYAAVGPLLAVLSPILLTKMYLPVGALLLMSGNSRNHAEITAMRCAALLVLTPLAFWFLGERWAYFVIALNGAIGIPRQLALAARITPLSPVFETALFSAMVALAIWAALLV